MTNSNAIVSGSHEVDQQFRATLQFLEKTDHTFRGIDLDKCLRTFEQEVQRLAHDLFALPSTILRFEQGGYSPVHPQKVPESRGVFEDDASVRSLRRIKRGP
jgi:hypothetical protein